MTPEATPYEGRRRLSVAHLLAALVALFVALPLVERLAYGRLLESALFTCVLLAGVSAVGGQRRPLIVAALLAMPAVVVRWLGHVASAPWLADVGLITAIVFVAYVIWRLFRFIILARVVTAEVLCAAISIYLLYAVAWALAFTLLWRWDPGAIAFSEPTDATARLTGFMAMYFSVQILSTITFGDILPVSNLARMLTVVEALTGVFYLAILIARLVGLYSGGGPPNEARS
jgi:hypothetical protein